MSSMTFSRQHSSGKADKAVGVVMTPSAYHAMMFKRKIDAGEYQIEYVKCFCGADNYTTISKSDRHDFKYSLCMCNECGILYANPRMTKESFKKFYTDDYRLIYGDFSENMDYTNGSTQTKADLKKSIFSLFDEYDQEHPKVIFEIGCGTGTLVNEFREFDITGVDYDKDAARSAKAQGLNVIHGGIEELEKLGKKADLIVLYHVLEHFLDLEKDLLRIRNLLNDSGILYISVPGLYGWNSAALIQNAHTYQFTAITLEYVMECCGFDSMHIDDIIESYWWKMDKKISKDIKPTAETQYILSHFSSDEKKLLPPIRVNNKFPLRERRINMEYTISSGMKEISSLVETNKDTPAIIIAGGPTINGYIDKIKAIKNKGAKIFSIERMYKWCLSYDIIPDYIIALDASDDVIESFDKIHPDTTHLIFAQCKKEVIDKLKHFKSYFFLCEQKGISIGDVLIKNGFKRIALVSPGGSVGIAAMVLAVTTGCNKLHIFGFDCHINEKDYADGITGVGHITDRIEVEINDRKFITTVPS